MKFRVFLSSVVHPTLQRSQISSTSQLTRKEERWDQLLNTVKAWDPLLLFRPWLKALGKKWRFRQIPNRDLNLEANQQVKAKLNQGAPHLLGSRSILDRIPNHRGEPEGSTRPPPSLSSSWVANPQTRRVDLTSAAMRVAIQKRLCLVQPSMCQTVN